MNTDNNSINDINSTAMKTKVFALFGLLLFVCSYAMGNIETTNDLSKADTLYISCTQEVYGLATNWSDEYLGLYPGTHIQVNKVREDQIAGSIEGANHLCSFTQVNNTDMKDKTTCCLVVARSIIVPVMNSSNPFKDEISKHGISPHLLAQAFTNPELQNWGTLLEKDQNYPLEFCFINEGAIKSGLSNFLQIPEANLNGLVVNGEQELISYIQQNPLAIGFCKLTTVIDENTKNIAEGISLVSIDKNGNGNIDFVENIYGNVNDLQRGVWIGKYPKSLVHSVYAVVSSKPKSDLGHTFLKWIIEDGQDKVSQAGFSALLVSEKHSKIAGLANVFNVVGTDSHIAQIKPALFTRTDILIFLAFAVAFGLLLIRMRTQNRKQIKTDESMANSQGVFDPGTLSVPKGLLYDKSHTWVYMKEEGTVKVGIDDFLQHITGPITRLKMKNAGDKIKKGDPFLSIIQNGKQLTIYAPISGTISEHNELLGTNTSVLNSSPYNTGWVYVIDPTNWIREIRFLIMERKYKEWIKDEFSRLKDFLSLAQNPNNLSLAYSTLQDGGEIKTGVLQEFGPEVWDDFQTGFIDIPQ